MSLTELARTEVPVGSARHRGHGAGALTSGARALFAAVSGLLLTCGIAVVLWAVTPSAAGGPQQLLRAGVAAFAAGNAMTLSIGRAALTLPPLMITIIAVALLAGITSRGQTGTDDRTGELTCTVAAAAVYAAVVTVAGVALGTPGAVAGEQWWRPFLLALVVVGTTVFFRGEAWRASVLARTPSWVPAAARLGAAGAAGVVGAGAFAVVLGLAGSFGSSSAVLTLAAPGPAAGFGMVLLGIAYLPNAVVAGTGYVTGVGFHIGGGTYSPFGSSPVELPAVSLLAAAPDGRESSRVGMVLLLVPVVVALLVGRAAVRRLGSRRERLFAVGTAAALSGVLVAVLAVVASGGITGGQWASTGAPPLLLGVVTAVILGLFGAVVAGLAGQQSMQTSVEATADADTPEAADDSEAADDPDAADDVVAAGDVDSADDVATEAGPDHDTDHDAGGAADIDAPVADAAEPGTVAVADRSDAAAENAVDADDTAAAENTAAAADDTARTNTAAADSITAVENTAVECTAAEPEGKPAAEAQPDLGASQDVGSEPGAMDQPAATATATGVAGDTVPLARREEDVLAVRPVFPSDADLGDQVRSRSEPRHVG